MTTMISEVYEAFRVAGVPDDKARKAAEALSAENLATKSDITGIEKNIIRIEKELILIKWMLGLVIAGIISLMLKAFFI